MSEKNNISTYILIVLSVLFIPLAYIYSIYLIGRDIFKKNYKSLNYIKSNKYLLFISISVLISIIFSKYIAISSFYGMMIFVCIGVISYVSVNYKVGNASCGNDNINKGDEMTKLLTVIYIASLVSYAIGFYQILDPNFIMPTKWVDVNEYNLKKRIYSSFFNPNIFGFYINIIILIICTRFSLPKDKRNNSRKFDILEKTTFICSIICLFYTFSRASWMSLILALLLLGLFFNKKYILFLVLIFICIFGADVILGINRFDVAKLPEDSSFAYRLELWRTSIKIIKDNYFTGISYGTLYKYTGLYSVIIKKYVDHCHNIYLQILLDLGIQGFLVFVFSLYYSVKNLIKQYLLDKNDKLSMFLLLLLTMTLTHGFVDAVSLTPQIMMILSLITGVALAIKKNKSMIVMEESK